MVALRKQYKLLMQHLTSQGSQVAPLKLRGPLALSSTLGGPTLSPPLPSPPSVLWLLPGCWVTRGQDAGRTDPSGCNGTLFRPVTGFPLAASTTSRPSKLSPLCPLTPSPAHKLCAGLWCAARPPPHSQLTCNPPQGQNETCMSY